MLTTYKKKTLFQEEINVKYTAFCQGAARADRTRTCLPHRPHPPGAEDQAGSDGAVGVSTRSCSSNRVCQWKLKKPGPEAELQTRCTIHGGGVPPSRQTTYRDGYGAGSWPYCDIIGAGTGSLRGLKWDPGLWVASGWAGVGRAFGAVRAKETSFKQSFCQLPLLVMVTH